MTLSALHARYVHRHQAHHNRLPSQTRTTKFYCCPRCNAIFFTPFISYKDGHTKICSDCSLIEDMEATGMKARYDGPRYWTIEQHLRVAAAEGLATSTHPSAPCAVPAPASDAPQPAAAPPSSSVVTSSSLTG